ncbi:MAG: tetratricopeptide repeat protein [Actinomycetota bacterium]|nr:tetratricopeptide repeat protein [Actinomycetota bacterium]
MPTAEQPTGTWPGRSAAAADVDENAVPRPRPAPDGEERRRCDDVDRLAHELRERGAYEPARVLDEDLFARRRRMLGDEHPDTLAAATGLALDLTRLGDNGRARALSEQTLVRQRRVLGDDHPDTLVTALTLAITLRRLGDRVRARRIGRWVDDRTHSRGPGPVSSTPRTVRAGPLSLPALPGVAHRL